MRREEHAVGAFRAKRQPAQELGLALHAVSMFLQCLARCLVDHRTDIGGEQERIAEFDLVHCTCDDLDHLIGHVVLHEHHAQRRAALARAVECRRQHIARNLFR